MGVEGLCGAVLENHDAVIWICIYDWSHLHLVWLSRDELGTCFTFWHHFNLGCQPYKSLVSCWGHGLGMHVAPHEILPLSCRLPEWFPWCGPLRPLVCFSLLGFGPPHCSHHASMPPSNLHPEAHPINPGLWSLETLFQFYIFGSTLRPQFALFNRICCYLATLGKVCPPFLLRRQEYWGKEYRFWHKTDVHFSSSSTTPGHFGINLPSLSVSIINLLNSITYW